MGTSSAKGIKEEWSCCAQVLMPLMSSNVPTGVPSCYDSARVVSAGAGDARETIAAHNVACRAASRESGHFAGRGKQGSRGKREAREAAAYTAARELNDEIWRHRGRRRSGGGENNAGRRPSLGVDTVEAAAGGGHRRTDLSATRKYARAAMGAAKRGEEREQEEKGSAGGRRLGGGLSSGVASGPVSCWTQPQRLKQASIASRCGSTRLSRSQSVDEASPALTTAFTTARQA